MDENIQLSSTKEVDKVGGWLITHWVRTWDNRIALTKVPDQLAAVNDRIAALQVEKATLEVAQAQADAPVK